jgi:Polyketide cyclase / dehydrase and lipid transport
MASYARTIDIQAPADTVSAILLDLHGWCDWTRTILEATPLKNAEVRPGTRVRVRQPRLPGTSVWTVDKADARSFEWNNVRRGLRTVARHRLDDNGQASRLTVVIEQDGWLARPVTLVYGRTVRWFLKAMEDDLKAAAEGATGPAPVVLEQPERLPTQPA